MVFGKDIFSCLFDAMVPVDLSQGALRSTAEFFVEDLDAVVFPEPHCDRSDFKIIMMPCMLNITYDLFHTGGKV